MNDKYSAAFHRELMSSRGKRQVICCVVTLFSMLMLSSTVQGQHRYEQLREQMVTTRVEAEGITNKAVLGALRRVPRHEFVPGAQKAAAYEDVALPIGHQQTISPPYVVAYMTETLDPQPEDRVLEIGTGSGYQAAVLAEIVKEVYTIEIVSPLSKQATKRLKDLKYDNVFTLDGDGYKGWPEHAPFDKIIVTCSPENVPAPLVEQLKEGGKMIVPVGQRYQQSFHLFTKVDGKLSDEKLISTLFVPMTGESEELRRIQPDPSRPEIVNGSFEEDENGDQKVDGWHYQRQVTMCTESPISGKYCIRFQNKDFGSLSHCLQGSAIDGREIAVLNLNYWIRCEGIVPGTDITEQAGVVVHFYDHVRREIGQKVFGKWRGSFDWQNARSTVPVPAGTREMIIRIGLNGATGQLDIDDLQLSIVRR